MDEVSFQLWGIAKKCVRGRCKDVFKGKTTYFFCPQKIDIQEWDTEFEECKKVHKTKMQNKRDRITLENENATLL